MSVPMPLKSSILQPADFLRVCPDSSPGNACLGLEPGFWLTRRHEGTKGRKGDQVRIEEPWCFVPEDHGTHGFQPDLQPGSWFTRRREDTKV